MELSRNGEKTCFIRRNVYSNEKTFKKPFFSSKNLALFSIEDVVN